MKSSFRQAQRELESSRFSANGDWKVGAAVLSGDLRALGENTNRRSGVSGRTSGSHISIGPGTAVRHEKLL